MFISEVERAKNLLLGKNCNNCDNYECTKYKSKELACNRWIEATDYDQMLNVLGLAYSDVEAMEIVEEMVAADLLRKKLIIET